MLLGLSSTGNAVPWTHPLVLTTLPLAAFAVVGFIIVELLRHHCTLDRETSCTPWARANSFSLRGGTRVYVDAGYATVASICLPLPCRLWIQRHDDHHYCCAAGFCRTKVPSSHYLRLLCVSQHWIRGCHCSLRRGIPDCSHQRPLAAIWKSPGSGSADQRGEE